MEHLDPSHSLIQIINQVFDMEKKLSRLEGGEKLQRNLKRIRTSVEEMGLSYHDPTGERFDETRTDCEASISGNSVDNLVIAETIKPIIRLKEGGLGRIIQRGVVIVEGKS